MRKNSISKDTNGAATELGYIFTFLLGVLLLSMFSLWAWDIETATRERWNQEALQANMDDLAAAIERADEASRMGDIEYSESVYWRATEADENQFTLSLNNEFLSLQVLFAIMSHLYYLNKESSTDLLLRHFIFC